MNQITMHPTEGDLFRLLDAECDSEESKFLRRHLSSCESCAQTHQALVDSAAATSELLGFADPTPQRVAEERARWQVRLVMVRASGRPTWRSPALRAAAVIALALTSALAVRPVRAWIAEQLQRLTGSPPAETVVPESGQVAPEAVPAGRAAVEFLPQGNVFTIVLATTQRAGHLTLSVGGGVSGTAEIVGNNAGDHILVLPGGLRIDNGADFVSEYRVVLPPTVTTVRVRVGGSVEREFPIAGIAAASRILVNLNEP